MNISYNGFNTQCVTMYAGGEYPEKCKCGPLTFNSEGKVVAALTNIDFPGVILKNRDGIVTAQFGGYVELPYSGEAPPMGFVRLAADGNGGVKVTGTTTFTTRTVLRVDKTNKIVGFLI